MLFNAQKTTQGISGEEETSGTPLSAPPLSLSTYIASGVVNVLALALPLTILQIYDRVLPNAAFGTLTALVIVLAGVIIVDGVLKYFRSAIVNWSAASFTHNLSTKALSAMLSTRPSRFSQATASEHLERMNAINGLGAYLGGQSRIVAVDILFIPIFAGVIALVGGSIFFVVLALFGIFGYLALRRTKALNEAIAERETHEARKHDFIIEVLRSMQTVKATAMEPLMMRRFERLQSAASVITKRVIVLTGTAQTYSALYASTSVVAIVGIGAVLVVHGRLTLGALACCILLSSQLLQPLMRSLASWNDIQLAKHRRARITSLFDECDEVQARAVSHQKIVGAQSVALRGVTVRHGEAAPLFENVHLEIPAGAMVAFKGADGSGRSSLLRILMGDTPLAAGDACIGDNPNLAEARALVRYVGQSPTIFRGTILDNITLFGEIPAKTALSAARLIGLDEDVVRMPLGYDTVLKSAHGRDVPAPMAQQISIARALALRPSVLILDEANTVLDFAGEQRFVEALERLRGKTTIVLATHRPSLLRLADDVYEVANGKVVRQNDDCSGERQAAS